MQIEIDRKTGILVGIIVALAVALGVVALNAYGPDTWNPMHNGMPHNGMMNDGDEAEGAADSNGFSSADVMFAQMMIPHHQQAVTMSDYALANSQNPKVLDLARRIKAAQAPEIEQMRGWLRSAGASEDTPMGHSMPMSGMLTDGELGVLQEKRGEEFDKLFLAAMIEHHKGALQMIHMIEDSANPEVRALAAAIKQGQTAEIAEMEILIRA